MSLQTDLNLITAIFFRSRRGKKLIQKFTQRIIYIFRCIWLLIILALLVLPLLIIVLLVFEDEVDI